MFAWFIMRLLVSVAKFAYRSIIDGRKYRRLNKSGERRRCSSHFKCKLGGCECVITIGQGFQKLRLWVLNNNSIPPDVFWIYNTRGNKLHPSYKSHPRNCIVISFPAIARVVWTRIFGVDVPLFVLLQNELIYPPSPPTSSEVKHGSLFRHVQKYIKTLCLLGLINF